MLDWLYFYLGQLPLVLALGQTHSATQCQWHIRTVLHSTQLFSCTVWISGHCTRYANIILASTFIFSRWKNISFTNFTQLGVRIWGGQDVTGLDIWHVVLYIILISGFVSYELCIIRVFPNLRYSRSRLSWIAKIVMWIRTDFQKKKNVNYQNKIFCIN